MLKWIETTGRSEEDAIAAALFQLGMDRDDVSVEVIERAKSGFLGFGGNPAKVRVSYEVPDEEQTAPAAAEETVQEAAAPAAEEQEPAPAPQKEDTNRLLPGDEVLIPQPSYVSYVPCTMLAGGKPVVIELEEKDNFKLTPEKLLEKITDKTKILVMPFPNNPTGAIMTKEDLAPIVDIIIEKDLFVISDEIYSELTYGTDHVTIAAFPGMKDRTILINGFSKSYAMTGWRLGYAAAPHRILEQMLKIHQFAIMCAPTTSQYAAVSALRDGDNDVQMMREAYDQRRRFVLHAFKEMGLDCFEPEGAFYAFPSIKRFGMTSDEFATRFLREEKVAVVPGTAFGASGEGFLRVSYAYSLKNLKEALGRMANFVKRLDEERK